MTSAYWKYRRTGGVHLQYIHTCVYVCAVGNNWISDLCGFGMSWCKAVFFECPLFLEEEEKKGGGLYWIMKHILLPDVWAGNGQMLWILPVIISCNNNGTNASTAAVLCVYLLRQNEGEKHIKVFLEQSTVGPFADVMRRNVALMGLHYTDTRFSFFFLQGCWTPQPRCIYSQPAVCVFTFFSPFCNPDLGHTWWNRVESAAAALTDRWALPPQ